MKEQVEEKMHKIDAISSLPDCLLHHILSFLKTKQSVQTSILSRRWINIWKSIPCLNLDTADFKEVENFKNFVCFVIHHKLLLMPEKLDTFNLTWPDCHQHNYEIISSWIYHLISLKPRVVHIDLDKDKLSFDSHLPNCIISHLFKCTSLESILLHLRYVSHSLTCINPAVINLPYLKNLTIRSMNLEDEFFQGLIIGCPFLEKLVLEYCTLSVSEKIRSSTIKTLIMEHTFKTGKIWRKRLRICMPNLEYLLSNFWYTDVSFENLESLKCANLYLTGCCSLEHDDEDEVKLLRSLSNAKTLDLSNVETMLQMESSDLPVFENLKHLVLSHSSINTDLKPIDSLLRHCPNLEKLTLCHIKMEKRGNLEQRGFNEIQCDNLKTVEIVNPYEKYGLGVNDMVQYIRLHLKTIKEVTITQEENYIYSRRKLHLLKKTIIL